VPGQSVDAFSLVAGLVAVGFALVSLLGLDVRPAVVWPVLLVAAGLVGLVAAVRAGRGTGGS
jgi:hypothetical protein